MAHWRPAAGISSAIGLPRRETRNRLAGGRALEEPRRVLAELFGTHP